MTWNVDMPGLKVEAEIDVKPGPNALPAAVTAARVACTQARERLDGLIYVAERSEILVAGLQVCLNSVAGIEAALKTDERNLLKQKEGEHHDAEAAGEAPETEGDAEVRPEVQADGQGNESLGSSEGGPTVATGSAE